MTTQIPEIPTGIPEPDTDAENDSEDKENGEGSVIGVVDTISTPVTGLLELDRDPGGDHNSRFSNFCFYNCRHEQWCNVCIHQLLRIEAFTACYLMRSILTHNLDASSLILYAS